MTPRYSNGKGFPAFRGSPRRDPGANSLLDDLAAFLTHCARSLRRFWVDRGRHMILASVARALRQARRNFTAARLFNVPHLLVVVWIVILLWGERWVFHSRVERCHWSDWENWVSLLNSFLSHPLRRAGVATASKCGFRANITCLF